MVLVDKMIKERATEIFLEGYDESSVTAISYDLHIEGIVCGEKLVDSFILRPGEIVFIKTKEMIRMPNDLMGRIGEKILVCVKGCVWQDHIIFRDIKHICI